MNSAEPRPVLVLNQLEAGLLSPAQAGQLLGLAERQLRRLRARYRQEQDGAPVHGNRGRLPVNAVDPEVAGRRELVFEGRLFGMSPVAARIRATELVATLELEGCADRKISPYSGGQRRRLDVGAGLVHQPQQLLLNEPTTGLDPQRGARADTPTGPGVVTVTAG